MTVHHSKVSVDGGGNAAHLLFEELGEGRGETSKITETDVKGDVLETRGGKVLIKKVSRDSTIAYLGGEGTPRSALTCENTWVPKKIKSQTGTEKYVKGRVES